MHTDEYEIAIAREVGVCTAHIRRHQRLLNKMETLHGMSTAALVDGAQLNELPSPPDIKQWHEGIEAMRCWSEKRDEYERLLELMKISAA